MLIFYSSVPVVLHMALGSLVAVILKVFSSSVKLVSTAQKLVKSWWVPICMWRYLKSFHNLVLALAISFFIPPADWWQWKSRIQISFKPADSHSTWIPCHGTKDIPCPKASSLVASDLIVSHCRINWSTAGVDLTLEVGVSCLILT